MYICKSIQVQVQKKYRKGDPSHISFLLACATWKQTPHFIHFMSLNAETGFFNFKGPGPYKFIFKNNGDWVQSR